jgi:hypothetical protein
MSSHSSRDLTVPTVKPRAVLAAVKAWPGEDVAVAVPQRRPALTAPALGAPQHRGRDEETAVAEQRN